MFGILSSALAQFANYFFGKVAAMVLMYAILYWLATTLSTYVISAVGVQGLLNLAGLNASINNLSSQSSFLSYLAVYFNLWVGLKLLLSAYGVRFMIRRIPMFG